MTTSAPEVSDTEAITAEATVAGPISMSEPLNETISKAIYTQSLTDDDNLIVKSSYEPKMLSTVFLMKDVNSKVDSPRKIAYKHLAPNFDSV